MGWRRRAPAIALACALVLGGASDASGANGRAYELVSPPDKSGNAVDPRATVQSTQDGSGIAYSATGAFGGAPTSVTGNYYRARRGLEAWATTALDAPQENNALLVARPTLFLSADLASAVQFSRLPLAPGASAGANLYWRSTTGRDLELAVASQPGPALAMTADLVPATARRVVAGTPGLDRFAFSTSEQLLPEAAPNVPNVYEALRGGGTRLVSRLPDGSVSPDGAVVGSTSSSTRESRPMSADGRRIVFQSPANSFGALYLRVDGERTIPLSVSQRVGDPRDPVAAEFAGASVDGTDIYFTSPLPLTDGGAGGIYRYDVPTGVLTQVTPNPDPMEIGPDVQSVVYVSEDGEAIYYIARNAFTPETRSGDENLYVTRGGETTFVAALRPFVESGAIGTIALSRSGRYLTFTSSMALTGADNTNPACATDVAFSNPEGICMEVYRFDSVAERLDCVSCGTPAQNRHATLGSQNRSISEHIARAVLDDGRVYLVTAEPLVREDVNGRQDVYEWQDGTHRLISTGRSADDSFFAEASPDGRDVFFMTSERLVGIDRDDELDLYDARVGGGLASQNAVADPASCQGDGCQGPTAPPASLTTAGSVDVVSAGNVGDTPSVKRPSIRVGKTRTVRGPRFALRVRVPAAGRISLTGASVASAARTVSRAGSYRVIARLTRTARSRLRRNGTLRVRVRLSYRQRGAGTASRVLVVTVKTR